MTRRNTSRSDLGLLLALGLLHGLLYLVLMPPWQHYDEPTHFEHAQLLATRGTISHREDYDIPQRRLIADSMYRFRFDPPGIRRDGMTPGPPDLGTSELDHPRLYYFLASLPIRMLSAYPVEIQLYGARLVSLACYLLTIVCVHRLAVVLAPERRVFALALPLLLIFSPTFTDIMTAVNNDALVNFTGAAFFLGCVLLLRDGTRSLGLPLALLGITAALLTKRSAVQLLPLLPLALAWGLWRRPLRWWTYAAIGGGALALALLLLFELPSQATVNAAENLNPTPAPVGEGGFATASLPARPGTALAVRPWVDALAQRTVRVSLSLMIQEALDRQLSQQRLGTAFKVLFLSSTSRLGWAHVPLPLFWSLAIGVGLSLSGVGLLLHPLRRHRPGAPILPLWRARADWLACWGLAAALLVVLGYLFLPNYTPTVYFPTGRYLFVVLLPMLLLLVRGVEGCLPWRWHDYGLLALVGTFVALDTTAWAWSILRFYYA